MANNLTSNPIQISGSVTSFKTLVAATLGTLFTLKVEKIQWNNPAVQGTSISIGDPASGAILAYLQCAVAGTDVILDFTPNPRLWRDFSIDVIPSGTLYIFTR